MRWLGAAVILPALAGSGRAYTVASALTRGCHEEITAAALRAVRAQLSSAPPLPAGSNERAMIDDAPFSIAGDVSDLGGAALLFAVRDNDLKGNDPADSFDLV